MTNDRQSEQGVAKFTLRSPTEVRQTMDGDTTAFDPNDWAMFRRHTGADGRVRAVRIPGVFQVGGDRCRNGYLVYDGERLYAMGIETFSREYELVRA